MSPVAAAFDFMYVCLFDIDGTLIDAGGAGESAMLRVLSRDFGLNEITGDIPSAGRTDAAITADLFSQHSIDHEHLPAFQKAYLAELSNALPQQNGCVLPGVLDIVENLHSRDDVALGLLTGNYEQAAWSKLAHYRLDRFFRFGAFGDIHPNRDDVARVAVDEYSARLGEIESDRVWIIGDTPSDIRCARAIEANVAAVATGGYSTEELAAHNPDVLLASLIEAQQFLDCLT